MKLILPKLYFMLLTTALGILPQYTYAQTDNNPCNFQWGSLQQALTHTWGNVYYRFQSSKCTNSGTCGWPIVSLMHTFAQPASVSIRLKGIDCSNSELESDFGTGNEIKPNDEYKDHGNWHTFKQVTDVVSVEVRFEKDGDSYRIEFNKPKNISRVWKNNKIIASNNPSEIDKSTQAGSQQNGGSTSTDNSAEINLIIQKGDDASQRGDNQQALQYYNEAKAKGGGNRVEHKISDVQNKIAQAKADEEARQQEEAKKVEEQKIAYQNQQKEYIQQQAAIQQENAKKNDEALGNAAVGLSNVVSSGIASNTDENFFHKRAIHLGLSLGIASPDLPMVVDENDQGTGGTNSSYIKTPAEMGLTGGISFHPIISNYFSLGLFASATWAFSPAVISGGGSTTSTDNSDFTSSEAIATLNYSGGAQIAVGAKTVKLLGGYFYNHYGSTYVYTSTSDFYYGSNTSTLTTSISGDATYNAQRMEFGLRLGSYKRTCFDFIYGLESFKDVDNTTVTNPIYKILIWKPSYFKIFAEFGNNYKSYGQNNNKWSDGGNKTGLFINVGLIYNKDWFFGKE